MRLAQKRRRSGGTHRNAGPAHGGDNIEPSSAALTGPLVVSNNPEGIYKPGVILSDMKVGPGKVGVYVHHSNASAKPLDFFVVVKPARSGAMGMGASGTSHSGNVSEHQRDDPNYE